MKKICVLGIFVADISFYGDSVPELGQTILGSNYNIGPGGKGANQCIAIARLGGQVDFITKIGQDDYGQLALTTFKENKIDTKNIIVSKNHQTGVAGIMVNKNNGRNAVNVINGAPSSLTIKEVLAFKNSILSADIFLTQLEIPKEVTLHCLREAKQNNKLTILNPAPASKLEKEFFNYIDYFTPNETEAEFYTGIKITKVEEAKVAANKILALGVKHAIITLGEKGVFYSDGRSELYVEAAKSIKAIDTTGAGDAFNGAFSFSLAQNSSIEEAIKFANHYAGKSTEKIGAGNAMPFKKDTN